jgi:TatD DNase family protein
MPHFDRDRHNVIQRARDAGVDLIMVETDCPCLAPVPHRGKRCEPAFVLDTARPLASFLGVEFEVFARHTSANARNLAGLPPPEN